MSISSDPFTLVQRLYDSTLKNTDASLEVFKPDLLSVFEGLSADDTRVLSEFIETNIKLPCTAISARYDSAVDTTLLIRELQLQTLFILESRMLLLKGLSEPVPDHDLSDWISELIGRLGVCLPDRASWKSFLNCQIAEKYTPFSVVFFCRYASVFGKTIYHVYLNLGIEPPGCLPKDDSEVTSTTSNASDNLDEVDGAAASTVRSPTPLQSPRSARASVRQSLPRALFTDPAIVAAAGRMSKSSAALNAYAGPPCASTPTFRPARARDNVGCRASSSVVGTPASAPHLVLIASQRSRRKGRTPTKRLVTFDRSSRRTKTVRTPPVEKSVMRCSKRFSSNIRTPLNRPGVRNSKVSIRSKRSTDHIGRSPPTSTEAGDTPKRSRHHRYVHETPNPERSYPRWERAKLAAAEKTKNKVWYCAIIVEESPIKPMEELGSPLRRLRRANSMLTSLLYVEAKESGLNAASPSASVSQTATSFITDPIAPDLSTQDSDVRFTDGCLSVAMSRAERWRRRKLEEELSLSQFTVPPLSQTSVDSPLGKLSTPDRLKPNTNSGLLCIPTGLRRHSSNLFANMISPEQPALKSPIRSPVGRTRTPLKSIPRPVTSPPYGLPLTATGSIASPHLHKFNRDECVGCIQSSPQVSMRSPKAALTTPRRRTAANRQRTRHLSGCCSSMRTVPVSPQIFDEEAMFLGREEFLNETNTMSSVGFISPPRTLSNRSDDDGLEAEAVLASLSKRRKHISPLPSSVDPPVLRLASLSKSTVQHSQADLRDSDILIPTACRLQPKPSVSRKRSRMTKLNANPIGTPTKQSNRNTVDNFPFLTKPARSPFAPLHVFVNHSSTIEAGHTFIPGETVDSTTTVSSQSASAVVALRQRLFGNSDSNETSSAGHDRLRPNDCVGSEETLVTRLPLSSPHGTTTRSSSCSRRPWDESTSTDVNFSPGLRELRRSMQENVAPKTEAKPTRPRVSCVPSTVGTAPIIRPRRSLFQ
ncbi:hypothetical protein PHET_03034 [Paragonimus heterotremus]|uniref:Uncharacterized protein n=1 Tax=Paragonimus heterotremus TaxID=100268 RepID=A0A8J4TKC9_9TREM|nr:hypothetical protein PHET_03034 [Paragonimus heterotremus]